MDSIIIGMLAETSIHPGSGRSTGFVDLPVARESITEYPVVMGSGLKGALKDKAREKWPGKPLNTGNKTELSQEVADTFGKEDGAGNLIVSDARLLLLPVRSLTGQYKWATCPYLLERLCRDIKRSGTLKQIKCPNIAQKPKKGDVYSDGSKKIFLEEREFNITGNVDPSIIESLRQLMPNKASGDRLESQLIVLCDDDFKWFASFGLPINARNVLDEKTKTSLNLWYEETLPTDCLFYALFLERGAGAINLMKTLINESPYLQMGGNETVGQGWFALKILGD